MDDGIRRSDCLLFVVSPVSVSSPICRADLQHAVDANKRILPVLHDPVTPGTSRPHGCRTSTASSGTTSTEPCAGCGRFRAPRTDPGPTDLHWQFVTASRTAARRRWAGAVIATPPRSPAAVCARAAAPGAHTDLTIADC